jgi:hypothetical protein
MPRFTIISLVDAYVEYEAEVEADTAEEAVDLAYDGHPSVDWRQSGVLEFDARRVYAADEDGEPIDGYTRGKG